MNMKNHKVFDISGGHDTENRNVQIYSKNTGIGQKWWIKYADKLPREPKKGELNRQFGLYVQRPFHIVSAMAKHRYLQMVGSNLAIKTSNG